MTGPRLQPDVVIPAKAGTQRRGFFSGLKSLGSRLRGNDGLKGYSMLLAVAMFAASFTAIAQPASDPTPLQFQSPIEEKRFHDLVAELRCVMCQNQSLAESNAQIAVDLRREVLELMRQGKDNREIKQFLVERYGEFVLYRPQVESKTWLLWFGPALVLLGGGIVVAGAVRKRRQAPAAAKTSDSNEEQEW